MIWLSMFIEVYRCEDGTGCHQWPTGNLRDIFMIFQDNCLVAARFWLIFVGTLLTNEGFSFSCLITGRFVKFEFIFPILGRKIPVLFFWAYTGRQLRRSKISLVIYWWNQWDDPWLGRWTPQRGERAHGQPGTGDHLVDESVPRWLPRMAFGSFEWIHLRMNYDIHGWF